MKFTIQREVFLKPLQQVCGVVERRQTLPVLSNLLLSVEPERVTLTSTDLEVQVVAHAPLEGRTEPGKITAPAAKLWDICRTLPDQAAIEISLQKERLVIRSGKSRFTLSTLPASEFPSTDDVDGAAGFSVMQKELKKAIDRTQFAMAQQDVRYYLNGLMMELRHGKFVTVATDGHRLALCETAANLEIKEPRQAIIPRKGIRELLRLLSDSDAPVEVKLGANHIRVSTPEVSFTSKLIDGRFPDYQAVLPKGGDKVVNADRMLLKQALTRASVLSSEKYRSVRFQLAPGVVRLHTHNPEQEEAEEEVSVDYQGGELEIGFNAGYLLDALSAIDEPQVTLTLSDPNSSCLIEAGAECRYVVMPMRL
ncbi:MAG: DNA polymerase III subunit beta [Pseudomonadota bacterium]